MALAFADLLSWQVHERDVPTGFSKVTLQQVLRADRAAWTRLIESQVTRFVGMQLQTFLGHGAHPVTRIV